MIPDNWVSIGSGNSESLFCHKSTQNEIVRFIQVIFYPGGQKTARLNQVSALQCPLYGGFSM